MRKRIVLLAFVCVSPALVGGAAEAKLIRYEIDGKRYSYSTNNIQQTREARARIAAAAAAKAARERAEAERAESPLAALFGSPAQRQASQAEARLQEVLTSSRQEEIDATSSVKRPRAGRRADARRARREAEREARRERRHKRLAVRAEQALRPTGNAARAGEAAAPVAAPPLPTAAPVVPAAAAPPPAGLTLVPPSLDQAHLAPAPALPPAVVVRPRDDGSLTDFVNQVRRAPGRGMPPRL
jgi:hypothetical protein